MPKVSDGSVLNWAIQVGQAAVRVSVGSVNVRPGNASTSSTVAPMGENEDKKKAIATSSTYFNNGPPKVSIF